MKSNTILRFYSERIFFTSINKPLHVHHWGLSRRYFPLILLFVHSLLYPILSQFPWISSTKSISSWMVQEIHENPPSIGKVVCEHKLDRKTSTIVALTKTMQPMMVHTCMFINWDKKKTSLYTPNIVLLFISTHAAVHLCL